MSNVPFGLGLYLPEEVQEQIAIRQEADRHWDQAEEFVKRLKALDERLDLIWVKQGATDFPVPGRWYIVRHGEHARASAFWVIQNDKGGYSPPTEQHLEALRARDSHAHPDVYARMARTRREEDRAREKRKQARSEERQHNLLERLTFNNRVQIPVSGADKDKL